MNLEITEWKDWSLPVLQECIYCYKIFPDKGCGICFECYERAIDEAYQLSLKWSVGDDNNKLRWLSN